MTMKTAIGIIFYFGCWRSSGHYLFSPGWRSLHDNYHDPKRWRIPSASQLDATCLFLPQPEKTGLGMITYLPAPHRTVLAWWGSPFDNRAAVNCAVIVDGKRELDEIWQAFKDSFPDPDGLITKPTLVSSLG